MIFQRTAITPLTSCLTTGVHFKKCPGHQFTFPEPGVPFSLAVMSYSRPYEVFMDATFKSRHATIGDEPPIRVRDAAIFLGVSQQTVYLWVERKQIPHLRVMGRNIRFLKSDLEPFRATFKQEVEIGKTE